MQNLVIGLSTLLFYFGFALCDPPEKISALNIHNRTNSEVVFFIENDPLYFGDPNYQEYLIESNEILTIHCFSYSNDPIDSYVDGTLFGRSMAPEFGIKVNSEILTVWSRPSSSSEISSNSPFNKRSWVYNSEKKPIDCDGVTDNGGNIQFNITSEDIGIE